MMMMMMMMRNIIASPADGFCPLSTVLYIYSVCLAKYLQMDDLLTENVFHLTGEVVDDGVDSGA